MAKLKIFTNGTTFLADTVARTVVYSADMCKFTEAAWYDGSEKAINHARYLTDKVLKAADRKLARLVKA